GFGRTGNQGGASAAARGNRRTGGVERARADSPRFQSGGSNPAHRRLSAPDRILEMITGSLSRRYAKALFELAVENGQEEALQRQLDRFVAAYARSPLAEV